jgi:alkylation response protein AidB-like acyl-CoA dehydrogenase
MMNFDFSENQIFLRDSVERFIAEQYEFGARRKRRAELRRTDREMWSRFAELGWLGILVPEENDGLGWTLGEAAVMLQELGKGLVTEPFLEGAVLAVRLLAGCAGSACAALLSKIASGEALVSVALLENGSRHGWKQLVSAARQADGRFFLDGHKILVAGGDAADTLIVPAKVGAAIGLFLVPANSLGIRRKSYALLDGQWASDFVFDRVELPESALIAQGEQAIQLLEKATDEAALCAGAAAIGCMDRMLEVTNAYLHARQQFGQALANFQVLQHRLADLFIETEMARSALYSGLAKIDGADGARRIAVSSARVRIDQAALKVGNQGIHLHGGMGMTMEYPIGHFYRRLMVLTRAFGDTEYHLERYESAAA